MKFFSLKDLRATPDMKTDKQHVASSSSSILPGTTITTTMSSSLTKNACLGSRTAPSGAVVRLEFLFVFNKKKRE